MSLAAQPIRRRNRPLADAATGVALYTRLSRDVRKTGNDIRRQRDESGDLADRSELTIGREFHDNDLSATNGDYRPGFEELLKAILAGEVKVLIVWHLDRLVRTQEDLLRVTKAALAIGGLDVRMVTGPPLDLLTATGLMLAQITTAVSEAEGNHKRERQAAQFWQHVDEGKAPMARGFGYAEGGAEIVESEAVYVREVFRRFNDDHSIRSIVRWLNEQGQVNTKGNPWTHAAVRSMLANPRYISQRMIYKGENKGQIVNADGQWPAIIDADVFRLTAIKLSDPARMTHSDNTRQWFGGGFYLCAECGRTMKTVYNLGKKDPATGKTTHVRGYRCSAFEEPGNGHNLSRGQGQEIDDEVESQITHYLNTADLWQAMAGDEHATQITALAAKRSEVADRAAFIEAEMKATPITEKTYWTALRAQAAAIDGELADIDSEWVKAKRQGRLALIVGTPKPGAAWRALTDIAMQIDIAREIGCVVRIHRPKMGPQTFRRESITVQFGVSDTPNE